MKLLAKERDFISKEVKKLEQELKDDSDTTKP